MPRRKKPPIAENTGAVPYGQGEALANAQRAIPVAPAPGAPPAPARAATQPAAPTGGGGLAEAVAAAQQMAPPSSGGIKQPTGRPDEPITAGLDIGAGPGMGKIGMPLAPEEDAAIRQLILAYQATGSSSIARIIEVMRIKAEARNQTIQQGRRAMPSIGPARPL